VGVLLEKQTTLGKLQENQRHVAVPMEVEVQTKVATQSSAKEGILPERGLGAPDRKKLGDKNPSRTMGLDRSLKKEKNRLYERQSRKGMCSLPRGMLGCVRRKVYQLKIEHRDRDHLKEVPRNIRLRKLSLLLNQEGVKSSLEE